MGLSGFRVERGFQREELAPSLFLRPNVGHNQQQKAKRRRASLFAVRVDELVRVYRRGMHQLPPRDP